MRFLVTGGAGFIGSHLVEYLCESGHRITVLDDLSTGRTGNVDRRARLICGNVADLGGVRAAMAEQDGCFHLAAVASVTRSHADWIGTHRVNQTGTVTVLEAARTLGKLPVVYASSAAVYGAQASPQLHEELCPSPRSAYGADKFGSELQARAGFAVHGIPSVGLRFFNVYGPRQDPTSPYSGVISIFADRVANGVPILIDGDGNQTRDFVFVSDVVQHLAAGMTLLQTEPNAHILNVCTGRATSIRQLAALTGELAGQSPLIKSGAARPGDMRSALGDPARAIAKLGLHAQISLRDGLTITMRCMARQS